jgi:uncharacterized membrane protein
MRARFLHILHILRTSFWPLPSLFCFCAIGLAHFALYFDREFKDQLLSFSLMTTPEGLRSLLSTNAAAILTLGGLVFSSTLVALTLASSQYGPRLLHNFIRSRISQITLGILLGNFLFCLVVLREVRQEFLPHIAALIAFLLTIGSLLAFIYFVHHLVHSLRAESIIASVFQELEDAIERLFPETLSKAKSEKNAESDRETWEEIENENTVCSEKSGYLQRCEVHKLVEIAEESDLRIRLLVRPGQLVYEGDAIVATNSSEEVAEKVQREIRGCFVVGNQRTKEQDFEFSIRQLVEIASRSLSPGINDPFTAINCIDFLSIAMAEVVTRALPKRTFHGPSGVARVRTRPESFRSLLGASFHQLRQDASSRADVSIRILEGLHAIGKRTREPEQLEAVQELASLVQERATSVNHTAFDEGIIRENHGLIMNLRLE